MGDKVSYIYVITNDVNGKQYVGKTNFSIERRFKEHIADSKKERCEKRPLYSAMNKYGVEHFYIEQLEECSPEDSANREEYWITKLNTYGHKGYNATKGGDGKLFYDYQKIADMYIETHDTTKIAKHFHCCADTVRCACKQYNIEMLQSNVLSKERYSKSVCLIEKDKVFQSLHEASAWLFDNNYTTNKSTQGISRHIKQVCENKEKTAYGFHWVYI